MSRMSTEVSRIAAEAIEAAKMEASFYGQEPTKKGFDMEVYVLLMDLSFENETARSIFTMCVSSEARNIDRKFYETIQPPCYMDENGDYTYDSSKWV